MVDPHNPSGPWRLSQTILQDHGSCRRQSFRIMAVTPDSPSGSWQLLQIVLQDHGSCRRQSFRIMAVAPDSPSGSWLSQTVLQDHGGSSRRSVSPAPCTQLPVALSTEPRAAVRTVERLLFVGCLTSQQQCISGTDLLRQFYVLPH